MQLSSILLLSAGCLVTAMPTAKLEGKTETPPSDMVKTNVNILLFSGTLHE